MEDDLLSEKLGEEIITEEDKQKLSKNLSLGKLVDENWKFFGSIEHFNDVIEQLFAPRINYLIEFMDEKISDKNIKDFFGRYIKESYKLLNFVSNYYKLRAAKRSTFINEIINRDLDEQFKSLTLSQKSILLLRSVEGVSCILTGMRRESYVQDILKVLHSEKILNAAEIIKKVSFEIESADN